MASKILLISLGSIGKRHLKNVRALLPDSEILILRHSIASHLPEDVDVTGLSFAYNISDALSFNPDCVIVSSPASFHIQHVLPFLELGAHIFIEKPLCTDSEDLTNFLNLASDSPGFIMVGYVLRFQPIFTELKRLMQGNIIGDILSADIHTINTCLIGDQAVIIEPVFPQINHLVAVFFLN